MDQLVLGFHTVGGSPLAVVKQYIESRKEASARMILRRASLQQNLSCLR